MGLTKTSFRADDNDVAQYDNDGNRYHVRPQINGIDLFLYSTYTWIEYHGDFRYNWTKCTIKITTDASGVSSLKFHASGKQSGAGRIWWKITENETLETNGMSECSFNYTGSNDDGTWSGLINNCNLKPNTNYYILLYAEYMSGYGNAIIGTVDIGLSYIYFEESGSYIPETPETPKSTFVDPYQNITSDNSGKLRGYRVIMNDDIDIYDCYDPELYLLEPVLELEINTAGSFEFIMPPNHRYYNKIDIFNCIIEVWEDNIQHWFGRPIQIEIDYYGQKKVYCEGALNFLRDSYTDVDWYRLGERIIATDYIQNSPEPKIIYNITPAIGLTGLLLGNLYGDGMVWEPPVKYTDAKATIVHLNHVIEEIPLPPNGGYGFTPYSNAMKNIWPGKIDIDGRKAIEYIQGEYKPIESEESGRYWTMDKPPDAKTTLETFNSELLDYYGGYIFLRREPIKLLKTYTDTSGNEDIIVEDEIDVDPLCYTANYVNSSQLESIRQNRVGVYANKIIFMDWLKEMPYKCNQIIEFGLNLLDFNSQNNGENIGTVFYGYGTKKKTTTSDSGIENTEQEYFEPVYYQTELINIYGTIEKRVDFGEVSSRSEIKKLLKQYAEELQYNSIVIECTAADLHPVKNEYEPFRIGQMVHCRSVPHGIDLELPVTKLTIELNKDNSCKEITLGTKPKETMTRIINKRNYWVGTKTLYDSKVKDGNGGIYFVVED